MEAEVGGCARKPFSQIPLHSEGDTDVWFFRKLRLLSICSFFLHLISELKNIKGMSPSEEGNPIHMTITVQIKHT